MNAKASGRSQARPQQEILQPSAIILPRQLQKTLNVPVGLVSDNYGGSAIEAWLSYDAISQDPDLKASADRQLAVANAYPDKLKDFQDKYKVWEDQNQRADHPATDVTPFTGPTITPTDWKQVTMPGKFAEQGLPDAGAVWLRQTVNVPISVTTSYLTMHLGNIHDFEPSIGMA